MEKMTRKVTHPLTKVGFPRASRIQLFSLGFSQWLLSAALLRNHFLRRGNKAAQSFVTVTKGEVRI